MSREEIVAVVPAIWTNLQAWLMCEKSEKNFALAVALKEEGTERAGFKPAPTKDAIAFSPFR